MDNVKENEYILGQSQVITVTGNFENIELNLGLMPNEDIFYGKVYGIVKNQDNMPISNALVKIMNSNYDSLFHTTTDLNGIYLFDKIPNGQNYKIFAVAKGMELSEEKAFSINKNETIEINFILEIDKTLEFSIITGKVINSETKTPIKGSMVSLFKNNNYKNLIALTYTNEYGEYIFREVSLGEYIIKISSLGYDEKSIRINITKPGEIFSIESELLPDENSLNGTISGVITNNNNVPIKRADVILYKVENNKLTPVSFTNTNALGVYLFINVPQGSYKIKANESEYVNINNNNFYDKLDHLTISDEFTSKEES